MLTITENARDYVRQIPNQPLLPSTAGLRISGRPASDGLLAVQVVNRPRQGDKVFDYDGARIFLDHGTLTRVKGKMLDARLDPSGRIQFVLTAQLEAAESAEVA